MTLRDRLYLRFFLFHRRYGRMWAALLEGVCLFITAVVIGLFVMAVVNLATWWYSALIEEHVKAAKQEAKGYEQMLVACLNGGVVGRTEDGETIGCQGAVTFRMGGVK